MKIDWFTVAAQALNFLILVWLMKRFLYKPVLDAIDQREKAVAAAVADAEAKKAEAAKDRDLFKRKNDDFDAQRTALVAEISEMAQHGPMGMGPWGGHHHPMMNDGADGAPDNSPDKD